MVAERKQKVLRIVRSRLAHSPRSAPAGDSTNSKSVQSQLGRKLMKWEAFCDLSAPGCKKFEPVKDGEGVVTDYRSVQLTGYLSTFGHVTPSDRQGDVVEPGAFKETIPLFMKNPVLLIDHFNSADNIAGRFTEVREDKNGLKVTASISDSAVDRMKHIRALIAEGNLKTLSMGGRFHYREDGRTIFKVDLFEGSLVSIPANPDALFNVRALTDDEQKQFDATAQGRNRAE